MTLNLSPAATVLNYGQRFRSASSDVPMLHRHVSTRPQLGLWMEQGAMFSFVPSLEKLFVQAADDVVLG
jgi:hypothetical protein